MYCTRSLIRNLNQQPYLKQSLIFGAYTPKNSFFSKKKQVEPVVEQQQPEVVQDISQNFDKISENSQQQQQQVVSDNIAQQDVLITNNNYNLNSESLFSNTYVSEFDLGNMGNAMAPINKFEQIGVLDKLSYLSPGYLYEQLDELTREILFYLAEPQGYGLGLGLSIAACSLGIKVFFMPLMTFTQINAAKMKLLEPEMKLFQATTQNLSKRGDYAGVKEAQKKFSQLRKQHGINNWITMISLGQIPILITWFLSLRFVCSQPEKYPALTTEGMLWFQDLSLSDPYFILPVISAVLSYFNISLNPNMQNAAGGNILSKYMGYMKYLPFVSLPIVAFFPAGLNVYWAITAATHLAVALAVRSQYMKKYVFHIPEYLPGTIFEKQNQKFTQKIIKATIVDNSNSQQQQNSINKNRDLAEQMAQGLTGKSLPNEQELAKNQSKFSNNNKNNNNAAAGGVKVFTTKPSKKKN